MGLRQTAETDLGSTLEDGMYGFGWSITITDPDDLSAPLTGYSNDISQLIDPETGQVVSGRSASVALRISSLITAGLGMPQGIADANNRPWLIKFNDINGNAFKFKVSQADPDRALGIVICLLELYQ